jgi:hypothetical protein
MGIHVLGSLNVWAIPVLCRIAETCVGKRLPQFSNQESQSVFGGRGFRAHELQCTCQLLLSDSLILMFAVVPEVFDNEYERFERSYTRWSAVGRWPVLFP